VIYTGEHLVVKMMIYITANTLYCNIQITWEGPPSSAEPLLAVNRTLKKYIIGKKVIGVLKA